MPIKTDKDGKMGERMKAGASEGLENREGKQHGPGRAHVNVNEGGNQGQEEGSAGRGREKDGARRDRRLGSCKWHDSARKCRRF